MARLGFRNNAKFLRLVHLLNMPAAHVYGLVEFMWSVGHESGDPRLGDAVGVELAAGWTGEPGRLTAALLNCGGTGRAGLIEPVPDRDGEFQIHDLLDHAPHYVHERARRASELAVEKVCGSCGVVFHSPEPRATYCCDACRQAGYRDRKGAALRTVTHPSVTVTEAGATVTDVLRPVTHFPAQPGPAQPGPAQPQHTHTAGVEGEVVEEEPAVRPAASANGRSGKPPKAVVHPAAAAIYKAYPRKKGGREIGLQRISEALAKVAERGDPPAGHATWADWMLDHTRRFAARQHREEEVEGPERRKWCPYVTTYFNEGRYDDDDLPDDADPSAPAPGDAPRHPEPGELRDIWATLEPEEAAAAAEGLK